MDALAHPGVEDEDNCPMIKSILLPGLRSFCSALKGEQISYKVFHYEDETITFSNTFPIYRLT